MRVARIITRLNRGGPSRTLVAVEPLLRARGVHGVLWTGTAAPGEDDLGDEARAAGIEVRRVPGLARSVHPMRDLRAFRHLQRELRAFRPDLVHTHTFKAGLLGRTLSLPSAPRRVHTFHGHLFENAFGALPTRILLALERRLARRCDRLIAVSERVRHDLRDRFQVAGTTPVEVLAGVVGEELRPIDRALARARTGLDPALRWVGCLARVTAIKAPRRFLEVAELVLSVRDDVGFVWVGDGDGAAAFDAEIARRGLGGRVRRLPWQSRTRDWHASLEVEVLLSDAEGLPLSLVEARALGVPVVATDVGGVRDLVRDGRDGRLVARTDLRAAAAAILESLDDPELAGRRAERARAVDAGRFTPEGHAERLFDLYEEVLGRSAIARASDAPPPTRGALAEVAS